MSARTAAVAALLARADACAQIAAHCQQEATDSVIAAQELCGHPLDHAVIGDYVVRQHPPFLVCKRCGFARETWDLPDGAPRVPRGEATRLVRRWKVQDDAR